MSAVRIGIVLLPEQRWATDAARWRAVEDWGFDHAWTYDHLAWRSLADGPWLATVPLLAAAAATTERIRLGTFVASPNFRHPVPFAKDVMGLDDISAGRLVLGIGSGGQGFDAGVLGPPPTPRERTVRFEEWVGVLDRLLTSPVTEHEGAWYLAHEARMLPGCIQQPRVPFAIAAQGPRALDLVARHGQGWITYGPAPDAASPAGVGGGGSTGEQDRWWAGLAELVSRAEQRWRDVGRDPATVDRYLSLDGAPVFSLSSVEAFADAVARAAALGFTDVVTHWPRPEGVYAGEERVLERVADRLGELRAIEPAPRD